MTPAPIHVRRLSTDADLLAAHPLLAELRPHVPGGAAFVDQVRRQEAAGYALWGGFPLGSDVAVVLAGCRPGLTLSRGPHLFVDDLITAAAARGHGYGTAMTHWLAAHARDRGLPRVWLDSRDTALPFYRAVGFTPSTGVPCSIEVPLPIAEN